MARTVRVLYVDDDSMALAIIAEKATEEPGLTIDTESDPLKALDRIVTDRRIDCVVTDYRMPKLDGITLLKEVQELRPELPVILLTGYGDSELASDALAAGAADYIEKTATIEQPALLYNRIRRTVDEQRREQTNRELAAATGQLISATAHVDVYTAALDVICETLDFDGAAIVCPAEGAGYRVVAERNLPEEVVEQLPETDQVAATMGADEPQIVEAGGPNSIETTSCWIPLGTHGVIVAVTDGRKRPVSYRIDAAMIAATNIESALTRVQQATLLSERAEELQRRQRELNSLRQTTEVIRAINRAITSVPTRDEIERLVCERLVGVDRYGYAWIGSYDANTGEIIPEAKAGLGADVSLGTAVTVADRYSPTTAETVIQQRQIAVESVPETEYRFSGGISPTARGSTALIPVSHNGVLYDLLVVQTTDTESFQAQERDVLAELGETIGYAIEMAERRRGLLSDTAVELAFSIECENDFITAFSDWADCTVTLENVLVRSDDQVRMFVTIEGADGETFREYVTAHELTNAAVFVDDDSGCVVTFDTATPPLLSFMADHGAALTAYSAADGVGSFSVTVPNTTDIRTLVDRCQSAFTRAELRAKREHETDSRTQRGFRGALEARLTDRQHETLQAAYHAGFFEWPRTNSGEEIADSLEIASPTFLEHLRTSERKLLQILFEQERTVYSE